MKLKIFEIKKLADEAYLEFSNKQINKFIKKFNDIINIINKIKKIKIKNIKSMNYSIKKKSSSYSRCFKDKNFKKNIKYKKFKLLSKNIKNDIYLAPKILN